MKTFLPTSIAFVIATGTAAAQDAQTTRLVATVTEAFFDQITAEDFATEGGFLSDSLATMMPADEWAERRRFVIARSGPTPRLVAHRLTYYQDDTLSAVVDFSAPATKTDTFICGYLVWSLPAPNRAGLTRFEQNIIDAEIFRAMPTQAAVETMTTWQCPPDLIATVLGLSVQE